MDAAAAGNIEGMTRGELQEEMTKVETEVRSYEWRQEAPKLMVHPPDPPKITAWLVHFLRVFTAGVRDESRLHCACAREDALCA